MHKIDFEKYQGTGNDFIMVDNRDRKADLSINQISQLCDRKFGIGSDGLILIQNHDTSDFEMIFYNPDGSQSLCGNGSRCAVAYACSLGLIESKTTFMAYDGLHEAEILPNRQVRLKMQNVQNVRLLADGMFVDTGSPHLVQQVDQLNHFDVLNKGKEIRNKKEFEPAGTNVNFVEAIGENEIFVRTYERGVENETLSCGTGVTAAGLASLSQGMTSPIKIKTKGGSLQVEFTHQENGEYKDIYLIGPAEFVFNGGIHLPA